MILEILGTLEHRDHLSSIQEEKKIHHHLEIPGNPVDRLGLLLGHPVDPCFPGFLERQNQIRCLRMNLEHQDLQEYLDHLEHP